jgi:hypothetical protein
MLKRSVFSQWPPFVFLRTDTGFFQEEALGKNKLRGGDVANQQDPLPGRFAQLFKIFVGAQFDHGWSSHELSLQLSKLKAKGLIQYECWTTNPLQ